MRPRPAPWLYPPDDYSPFFFATPPAAPVLNTEIDLGNFITSNRWLRIAVVEFNKAAHPNNSLRFAGQGWGELTDFCPVLLIEQPIFVLLPPLSQHFVRYIGQAQTDAMVRLVGWYF